MRFVDRMPRLYLKASASFGLAALFLPCLLWAYGGEAGANGQAILQQLQMQQSISSQPSLSFKTYDDKLFMTAYQAYLFNGEPAKAFQIAQAAVALRPEDILWRERLAQSATWSSHAQIALDQYLYFFHHNHQKAENLEPILTLSMQLQNYDLQVFALQEKRKMHPEDAKKIGLELVKAMQGQGRPRAAIAFVKKQTNYESDKDWQKVLYQLAFGTANTAMMLKVLERSAVLDPKNPQYPTQIASILWNQGKPEQAFAILHRYFLQHRQTRLGKTFLYSYVYAASTINQPTILMEALRYLFAQHGANRFEMRDLVYFETVLGYEKQAFQHALLAYRKRPDRVLLANLLNLGLQLHQERTVLSIIEALSPKERQRFLKGYIRRINLANLYWATRQYTQAAAIWAFLVQRFPDKQEVQAGYLWFLIDFEHYPALQWALTVTCPVF